MSGMHQIVVKFVAAVCFTASLYAFIAFSPNKWHQQRLVVNNKMLLQVPLPISAFNTDSERSETNCCQTFSTTTPTLSSPDLNRDKKELKFKYLMDKFVISSDIDRINQSQTMSCVNHLSMIFTVTDNNVSLDKKLHQSLLSVFKHIDGASNLWCIHLITDSNSQIRAKKIIEKLSNDMRVESKAMVIFYFHSISAANSLIEYLLPTLKRHFSYKPNSYYSHSLFFVSLILHRMFDTIDKIILLDIDVQLNDRLEPLYQYFSKFGPQTIIGIAYEQQPVYRHVLHEYRHTVNNLTLFGSPPSNGMPGFNSGVLLMDLKKMRESKFYNSLLVPKIIDSLCAKYLFRGHLGDQDFYTIISFDYFQLFYIIPCYWNRQLCQWWRYHGYDHIFDQYNRCDAHIKLFHGNCNAVLPN